MTLLHIIRHGYSECLLLKILLDNDSNNAYYMRIPDTMISLLSEKIGMEIQKSMYR